LKLLSLEMAAPPTQQAVYLAQCQRAASMLTRALRSRRRKTTPASIVERNFDVALDTAMRCPHVVAAVS
jgi:hypothetical protein